MDLKAFLTAIFEFVKNLLKYLGEWPFPEEETEEETTEPEA